MRSEWINFLLPKTVNTPKGMPAGLECGHTYQLRGPEYYRYHDFPVLGSVCPPSISVEFNALSRNTFTNLGEMYRELYVYRTRLFAAAMLPAPPSSGVTLDIMDDIRHAKVMKLTITPRGDLPPLRCDKFYLAAHHWAGEVMWNSAEISELDKESLATLDACRSNIEQGRRYCQEGKHFFKGQAVVYEPYSCVCKRHYDPTKHKETRL